MEWHMIRLREKLTNSESFPLQRQKVTPIINYKVNFNFTNLSQKDA